MEMVSGAGHDSCNVSAVVPTAMVFVPCAGGLSHNEAESAHCRPTLEAGANVLLHAMLSLAKGSIHEITHEQAARWAGQNVRNLFCG
jgi:acetylornithine deacetylase/succinyl-diaminopimelate desuccinylase-like protein